MKALEDPHDGVRRNAVFALARIGKDADGAVEGLQNLLFDANRYVRGDAVHALYRIGTSAAKSVLLRHLQTTALVPDNLKRKYILEKEWKDGRLEGILQVFHPSFLHALYLRFSGSVM